MFVTKKLKEGSKTLGFRPTSNFHFSAIANCLLYLFPFPGPRVRVRCAVLPSVECYVQAQLDGLFRFVPCSYALSIPTFPVSLIRRVLQCLASTSHLSTCLGNLVFFISIVDGIVDSIKISVSRMNRCTINVVGKHSRSARSTFFTTASTTVPQRQSVEKGFVTPMRDVANSVRHPDYSMTGRPKPSPK